MDDGRLLVIAGLVGLAATAGLHSRGARGVVCKGRPSCDVFSENEKRVMFVVSTAHLTKRDAELLIEKQRGTQDDPFFGGPTGHGWIVWADEGAGSVEAHQDFSKTFLDLIHLARRCGANFIQFDEYGPVLRIRTCTRQTSDLRMVIHA